MKEYRRVPLAQLRKRLRVEEYETDTLFAPLDLRPRSVRIKLSQRAGKPARPAVKEGDAVEAGAVVGCVEAPDLGANVHASIAGKVRRVTDSYIEIHA